MNEEAPENTDVTNDKVISAAAAEDAPKTMLGRPTKYQDWMPDRAFDILKEGRGIGAVAVALDLSEQTIHAWREDPKRSEFSEACRLGLQASKQWWMELGRQGAAGERPINAACWSFSMKNLHGWADKSEINQSTVLSVKGVSWDGDPGQPALDAAEPAKLPPAQDDPDESV